MALNWTVLIIGALTLAAIPGMIILFIHNARAARRVILLALGALVVLHGIAWIMGAHYLQNSN